MHLKRFINSYSNRAEAVDKLVFRSERYNEYFEYFATEIELYSKGGNQDSEVIFQSLKEDYDKKCRYLDYIGLRTFLGEWGYEQEFKKLPFLAIEDFPISEESRLVIYGIYRSIGRELTKKLDCGNNKKLEILLTNRQRNYEVLGRLGSNLKSNNHRFNSINEDKWIEVLVIFFILLFISFFFGEEVGEDFGVIALIPITIAVFVISESYTTWRSRYKFKKHVDETYKIYSEKNNISIKQLHPFIYSTSNQLSNNFTKTSDPQNESELKVVNDLSESLSVKNNSQGNVTKKEKEIIDTQTIGKELEIDDNELITIELSEEEGILKEVKTKTYSRSKKNRELALKIHGRTCIVCNFNFDKTYGKEISDGFIHIHHTKPLHKNGVNKPNIITDLVPLCSNCHSMVHRTQKELSIGELRKAISKNS